MTVWRMNVAMGAWDCLTHLHINKGMHAAVQDLAQLLPLIMYIPHAFVMDSHLCLPT